MPKQSAPREEHSARCGPASGRRWHRRNGWAIARRTHQPPSSLELKIPSDHTAPLRPRNDVTSALLVRVPARRSVTACARRTHPHAARIDVASPATRSGSRRGSLGSGLALTSSPRVIDNKNNDLPIPMDFVLTAGASRSVSREPSLSFARWFSGQCVHASRSTAAIRSRTNAAVWRWHTKCAEEIAQPGPCD